MFRTMRTTALSAAMFGALAVTATTVRSQNNPASTPATAALGPAINAVAPDFTLTGATRYGVLKDPVRLSDFRGRTVVLAFFAQARTKG